MKRILISIIIAISILIHIEAITYIPLNSINTIQSIAGEDDPPIPDPDSDYYWDSLNTFS